MTEPNSYQLVPNLYRSPPVQVRTCTHGLPPLRRRGVPGYRFKYGPPYGNLYPYPRGPVQVQVRRESIAVINHAWPAPLADAAARAQGGE